MECTTSTAGAWLRDALPAGNRVRLLTDGTPVSDVLMEDVTVSVTFPYIVFTAASAPLTIADALFAVNHILSEGFSNLTSKLPSECLS